MRWNESSRLRYRTSPWVVAKFQSGCPCATHAEQAAQAFQAVANGFASLPLYRLYWDDVQLFASMDVRELFVGEAQEAFREYVMQDDTLPRFMQE